VWNYGKKAYICSQYADVNPATGRMGVYNMGRNITVKLDVPLTF